MMTSVKEINKEFNLAKKHFKKAIELGKRNLIIGEVNFPKGEKKIIKERLKKLAKIESSSGGKSIILGDETSLPDFDKGGYMKKRGE